MENEEKTQKAIEYAKNYPQVLKDSHLIGPVTVGNVGLHNGRVIVNLCLRTLKSGDRNATISFPREWAKASRFQTGDVVNVSIQDGYVRNIWHARPEPIRHNISAAVVNQEVSDAIAAQQSEKPVEAPTEAVAAVETESAPF